MPGPIISDTSICNSALLKVGAEEISSLDDDTRASNTCKAMFETLRDEVMRAAPWRFALEQRILAIPSATLPAFQYSAAYDIPNDILRPLTVNVDKWTEMSGQIYCYKTDGIEVLAIVRNTDPSSWDIQFAETLAWRLAMQIALALVQSMPLKQDMEKGYEKSLALARSTNAVVGTPERLLADFWTNSRKYGFTRPNVLAGPSEPYGP